MRRLLLIRHAQAGNAAVDTDRPLTERGGRQATGIGSRLEQSGFVPDRVLVSSARRAVQTWEAASARLQPSPSAIVDPRVYDNTVEALLAIITETPEDVQTLAVVGHNPSVGELAHALDDGQGDPDARRALEAGFPTASVAVFTVDQGFSAIAPGDATLTVLFTPKD